MAAAASNTVKIMATTFGCLALGYGLMIATVPTEEETYNAMAPDLRRKVDANRKARLEREEATRKQFMAQKAVAEAVDPDELKPVWVEPKK